MIIYSEVYDLSVHESEWKREDLSQFSIFYRSKIRRGIDIAVKFALSSTSETSGGKINSLELDNIPYLLYCKRSESARKEGSLREFAKLVKPSQIIGGKMYIVICKREYPQYSIFQYIKSLQLSNDKKIRDELFLKYQTEYDKLDDVKIKVNEVTEVMKINIEKALENNEILENLECQASQLREEAIKFTKDAKKVNRCCRWW